MNGRDRWGPVWHTSDTALAQTDGSWITEETGGWKAEGNTEAGSDVCEELACIHEWACTYESLWSLSKDETKLALHSCYRQIGGCVKIPGSDRSNNRQWAGNILTVIEWACNQRGVRSNPFSTGRQLEGNVEVRSSLFQQLPSNYHRPFNDALTSQLLIITQRVITQDCVGLNICKLPLQLGEVQDKQMSSSVCDLLALTGCITSSVYSIC